MSRIARSYRRVAKLVFARGLLFGFQDDFSSAAAVLIPQVEHALRTLLLNASELPYKQDAAGVQDFWDLNRVLEYPTLEAVLGSDEVFDLRSLLVSRFGQTFEPRGTRSRAIRHSQRRL